jgi:hypothetical protein
MAELGDLTLETFAERLTETFRIRRSVEDVGVDVTLSSAEPLAQDAVGGRMPFSIMFRGPADRILPQQIFAIEHETLGTFELFLVPLTPDRDGARYEAVFA